MQDLLDLLATFDLSIIDGLFTLVITFMGRGIFKERSERKAVTDELAQQKKRIELKEREDDSANQRALISLLEKSSQTHDRLVTNGERANDILAANGKAVASVIEMLGRHESQADARMAAVSALVASEHDETRRLIHEELAPLMTLARQLQEAAVKVPDALRADFKTMADEFITKARKLANGHAEGRETPPPEVKQEATADPGVDLGGASVKAEEAGK